MVKDKALCGKTCFGCMAGGGPEAKPAPLSASSLNLPLKPGRSAETTGRPFLGQALAALLPLPAGFAAGFFLLPLLFPGAGDPARAAGGVFAMLAAAAGYYLFRCRYPPGPPL